MNNYKNLYRVAKMKDKFKYGIGPYGYLMNKNYEKLEGKSEEDVANIKEILYSKERWSNSKLKDSILDILHKHEFVMLKTGCPSTFFAKRPGPWDDPVIKYNLIKRFGNSPRTELVNPKRRWAANFFAFDSEEQMHNWFDTAEDWSVLKEYGFEVYKERVQAKWVVPGLKQVWYLEEIN